MTLVIMKLLLEGVDEVALNLHGGEGELQVQMTYHDDRRGESDSDDELTTDDRVDRLTHLVRRLQRTE